MSLTPALLLRAYAAGVFPMAEGRDDPLIHWIDPQRRAIFPMEGFHTSRSLARHIRRIQPRVTVDRDFAGVVRACAHRTETWINGEIFGAYTALFDQGHAHSLELWQDGALIGGDPHEPGVDGQIRVKKPRWTGAHLQQRDGEALGGEDRRNPERVRPPAQHQPACRHFASSPGAARSRRSTDGRG
jgi:hypothetical protein